MVNKGKQRLPVTRDTTDCSIILCLAGINPYNKDEWKTGEDVKKLILEGRRLRPQEIAKEIGLNQSNVIRHLQYLYQSNVGYVGIEKKGKTKYYFLKFDKVLESINNHIDNLIIARLDNLKILRNSDKPKDYKKEYSKFNTKIKNDIKKNESYRLIVHYMLSNYRIMNMWTDLDLDTIFSELVVCFGTYINDVKHRISKGDLDQIMDFHRISNLLIANPLAYEAFTSELIPSKK